MDLKKKILFTAIVISILLSCSEKKTADVIYTSGKIYTVDENQPWAEALAIKDGGLSSSSRDAG